MQDAAAHHHPRSYQQAHATRFQAPRRAKKPPVTTGVKARNTLYDALQQHGARLCDGTKLNAVGCGIECIGDVPAAVSTPVSALFLSQNRLATLKGVEQFTALRVLSAAGNALASFDDVVRLTALPRLRALNLMGNPLCDQPHYRLRVVDCLANLQVLDTTDVSKREREQAPKVAAQERALRAMVLANHFATQKLQRIARLVQLRSDLAGFVLGYVASGKRTLAFDRVPSPQHATVNVAVLMRLWDLEQSLSHEERNALERQMLAIVFRTRNKLAEHPKLRAKTYLLQLASTKLAAANGSERRSETRQQSASWDDAYASVLALQHQTIAGLQGLCDRNNQELVAHLKTLLTTEPSRRRELVHAKWGRASPRERAAGVDRAGGDKRSGRDRRHSLSPSTLGQTRALPPQQPDPDQSDDNDDNDESVQQRRRLQDASTPAAARIASCPAQKPTPTNAFVTVSKLRVAPMSLDDVSESHELAVNMNHGTLGRKSSALGASQCRPDVDESIETVSSVSGFSDTSSFWTGRQTSRQSVGASASRPSLRAFHSFHVENSGSQKARVSAAPHAHARENARALQAPRSSPRQREDDTASVVHSYVGDVDEEEKAVCPQLSTSPAVVAGPVAVSDHRLHELEEREAKYIKALIESEQRELDLRSQLNGYRQKIGQYRLTLVQNAAERKQIKLEVDEKVQTVAAPRVLRRFFVHWIRHYHWSLQVAHFRRRRCFIEQHDWFWRWRRTMWTHQHVRDFCAKQQGRSLRRHFVEWTNLSRLAVIVAHAQRERGLRFARRAVQAWRAVAKILAMQRRVEERQALEATRVLQRCCFRQWAKRSRHRRQLTRAIALQARQSSRALHERVFWRWRALVFLRARPMQARVEQLVEAKLRQRRTQALVAWRNLVRGSKLHDRHLQRRVWTHWKRCSLSAKTDREVALRSRRTVVIAHLQSWRFVAQEQVASRRSLGLAKRYVNQRRLRKLWLYWKRYTFAKRKYVQGSTKALKHYFVKLLRGSWQRWKIRTRQNLMNVKETNRSELRRHFQSLRTATQLVATERTRARMLAHLRMRRRRALLHRVVFGWHHFAHRQRRSKVRANVVSRLTARMLLQRAWDHWMAQCLVRLREQIGAARQQCEGVLTEKNDVEADLLVANDRSVSLSERAASLEATIREQERELAAYQHELLRVEGYAQELQSRVSEEQARADETKRQHESAEHDRQRALDRAKSEQAAEVARLEATTSELAARVVALEAELGSEQRQKEEIASRLHEYETRLATARDGIRQHDEAQLRENERLRLERDRLDALVAAERVRSTELQQLMGEKNVEIQRLAQSLQQEHDQRDRAKAMTTDAASQTIARSRFRGDSDESDIHPVGEVAKGLSTSTSPQPHTLRLKPRNRSRDCAVSSDSSTNAGTTDTTLHSLLKDINESIRARTESTEKSASPCPRYNHRHHHHSVASTPSGDEKERYDEHYTTEDSSRAPSPTQYAVFNSLAEDTDAHIDEHTNKIHDDIRQLQERIAKRLQQPPATATAEPRQSRLNVTLRGGVGGVHSTQVLSPRSSLSSLSDPPRGPTVFGCPRLLCRRDSPEREDPLQGQLTRALPNANAVRVVSTRSGSRKTLLGENVSRAANAPLKRPSRLQQGPLGEQPNSGNIGAKRTRATKPGTLPSNRRG